MQQASKYQHGKVGLYLSLQISLLRCPPVHELRCFTNYVRLKRDAVVAIPCLSIVQGDHYLCLRSLFEIVGCVSWRLFAAR
jgi:hypothetical protein